MGEVKEFSAAKKCQIMVDFMNNYGADNGEEVERINITHSTSNPITNTTYTAAVEKITGNKMSVIAMECGYLDDDKCIELAKEKVLEACKMDKETTWNQMELMLAVVSG